MKFPNLNITSKIHLKVGINLLINLFFSILIIWLFILLYNNAYLQVIAPADLKQEDIISRRKKVNIQQFEIINNKINEKKSINSDITKLGEKLF